MSPEDAPVNSNKNRDGTASACVVHLAQAVAQTALSKTDLNSQWVNQLRERSSFNRAAIAVANKNVPVIWNVRVIWAVLRTNETLTTHRNDSIRPDVSSESNERLTRKFRTCGTSQKEST
jgi:hypothetical protein